MFLNDFQTEGIGGYSFEKGMRVEGDELTFYEVNLCNLLKEFGSPLKFSMPHVISYKIQVMQGHFEEVFQKCHYDAKYYYTYCTKSSHFKYVLDEVLKNDVSIETSSAYDFYLIDEYVKSGKIGPDRTIVCNGIKGEEYLKFIASYVNKGFENCIPVLDSLKEAAYYEENVEMPYKYGVRVSTIDKVQGGKIKKKVKAFSRFGERAEELRAFFSANHGIKKGDLCMLHFSVSYGMSLKPRFIQEITRIVELYCDLKLHCPHLKHLNIGGGIGSNLDKKKPGKTRETIAKIVGVVKKVCQSRSTEVPNIFTEFGHYTVAESSGVLGTVTQTKARTKKSLSYIVDFSVINLMPDIGIASSAGVAIKAFPLNLIQNKQVTAELSGLTCDSDDHSEPHHNMTFPEINAGETLHVGFFNTGSYQDDVSGYTGLHLCMLPNPRHVILKKNERGQIKIELFSEEQSPQQIMKILGY